MSNLVMKSLAADPTNADDTSGPTYRGEPTLTLRGRLRVDAKGPSSLKTYRCCFSVVAGGPGDFAELRGAAGARGWVTKVTIFKPSVPATIDVIKRTAQDTGGTSSAGTITRMETTDGVPTFGVLLYTAAPSAGATTGGGGNVYPSAALGAGDVLTAEFGERDAKPAGIAATESLALKTSGAATIVGMIEWTEAA